ncbi:hypothetical protein AbraIFM66950_008878, partial [Aspergillus brasiliensis]
IIADTQQARKQACAEIGFPVGSPAEVLLRQPSCAAHRPHCSWYGQDAELRSLRRSPWVETAAVIGQEEQSFCVQRLRGGPVR